jgi:hypothetical protein
VHDLLDLFGGVREVCSDLYFAAQRLRIHLLLVSVHLAHRPLHIRSLSGDRLVLGEEGLPAAPHFLLRLGGGQFEFLAQERARNYLRVHAVWLYAVSRLPTKGNTVEGIFKHHKGHHLGLDFTHVQRRFNFLGGRLGQEGLRGGRL